MNAIEKVKKCFPIVNNALINTSGFRAMMHMKQINVPRLRNDAEAMPRYTTIAFRIASLSLQQEMYTIAYVM